MGSPCRSAFNIDDLIFLCLLHTSVISQYTTVRFQAVLITDGTSSYAVFIYDCGGMEWGGAEIGWQYNSSLYREHYLSGSSSASIGCQYSSTYSAIVYRLDRKCFITCMCSPMRVNCLPM